MLRNLSLEDLDGGLNLIDIGASGRLDRRWRCLEPLINLVGFEPNQQECERLSKQPTKMHSARYLPYALSGEEGRAALHKTESIYCYSLLPPNNDWLERFEFGHLFRVVGSESIDTHCLGQIPELVDFDVDVIKTDTQGLELPILSTAGELLERVFMIETETGFVENYIGETTFAQIAEFMRDQGFLLFDMNARHRISRRNRFARLPTGKEQMMWCEAIWLRDLASRAANQHLQGMTRAKALKAFLLCAHQGCTDFGYELAGVLHQRGLLTAAEYDALASAKSWRLHRSWTQTIPRAAFGMFLRLLPQRMRREFAEESERALNQPSLLRAAAQSLTPSNRAA